MKLLLKIIGINLLVFIACSALIEFITRNDREGFAYCFYYAFFMGLQILTNLIMTIATAIKKSPNLKYYTAALLLTIVAAIVVYGWII